MATQTLIIVVGGDYLALEICREILKTAGHHVALIWRHTDERASRSFQHEVALLSQEFGVDFGFFDDDPVSEGALARAGLRAGDASERSYCLVAVAQDDRLNFPFEVS